MTKTDKLKLLLKNLFLTKEGWISWLIANVITSLPWFVPLSIGYLFDSPTWYSISAAIWAFVMLPITPFWIFNIFIAYFFLNILKKQKTR
jgi:hypothetical protein